MIARKPARSQVRNEVFVTKFSQRLRRLMTSPELRAIQVCPLTPTARGIGPAGHGKVAALDRQGIEKIESLPIKVAIYTNNREPEFSTRQPNFHSQKAPDSLAQTRVQTLIILQKSHFLEYFGKIKRLSNTQLKAETW